MIPFYLDKWHKVKLFLTTDSLLACDNSTDAEGTRMARIEMDGTDLPLWIGPFLPNLEFCFTSQILNCASLVWREFSTVERWVLNTFSLVLYGLEKLLSPCLLLGFEVTRRDSTKREPHPSLFQCWPELVPNAWLELGRWPTCTWSRSWIALYLVQSGTDGRTWAELLVYLFPRASITQLKRFEKWLCAIWKWGYDQGEETELARVGL